MANSPASLTVVSAASPPSIAPSPSAIQHPSLCMKPMPTAGSPAPNAGSPMGSLTTKEWIVPPRPKPGRKPATDTPPTKRKAQNRAAQRAFRERRAARVGELEEQMKQVEDEHEQQQDVFRQNIATLEKEIEQYRHQLSDWVAKCRQLEKELADTKAQRAHIPQNQPTMQVQQSSDSNEDVVGCGNCTMTTRCQCIDDAFNAMNGEVHEITHIPHEKRPSPPQRAGSGKRIKLEPADNMEIDFTAMYSKSRNHQQNDEAVSPSSAVADPCGFCQDGTPCICAEMAAEQERQASLPVPNNRQMAQFTPPPSEGDVAHTTVVPSSNCASGPGTCTQCRADPNSTLFCKSLAASRSQSGAASSGCCGGKGREGGCCQDSVPLPPRTTRSRAAADKTNVLQLPPPKPSITLTCADAYTTLSRHPAYERASGDIANWMPKLHANPASAEGRPAMEIDAANVMAVLRDFDRRFGSDR